MNNGIKLLHLFSIGLYPLRTILLLSEIYIICAFLFACWVIFHAFCCRLLILNFFFFSKNWILLAATITFANSFDPDQVGPDLDTLIVF